MELPKIREQKVKIIALVAVFFILGAAYLIFDEFNIIHFYTYLFRVKGIFKFCASLFLYSGLLISMVLLICSGKVIRIISLFLILATLSVEVSYYLINGYGFTFTEASVAQQETGFAFDAISTFFFRIWFVIPAVSIFVVMLYYVSNRFLPHVSWKISLPVTVFFFLLGYYVLKGTSGAQTYPSMFKIPMLTIYSFRNAEYMGPREPVTTAPVKKSDYRYIIYLVDESVRGDYLSINNCHEYTTPFLLSVSQQIYNYGIMSSGGNYSRTSQLILRSGVKQDFFPDTNQNSLRVPDIFQYAKKAGFSTVMLDGQKDILQNFMKQPEMKYIDYYFGVPERGMDGSKIDYLLADKISDFLHKKSEATFIYVVKMGAHFNYENYYPADQKIFNPTMKPGELNNDRTKMINSYRNVIRWNIDGFFQYLINKLKDLENYMIIYTSDHGQTLLDHGIVSTHADVRGAHPFQACVPFFVYFQDTLQKKKFVFREENYDHLSHFNIFPSILLLMGYDTVWVRKHYDNDIFEKNDGKRYFYTGMLFNKGNGYRMEFDTPEIKRLMMDLNREIKKRPEVFSGR